MKTPRTTRWAAGRATLLCLVAMAATGATPPRIAAQEPDLTVMTSGAFGAAYDLLMPEFARTSGLRIATVRGASMGDAPTAIPNRLARGERADLVILARSALDGLVGAGLVVRGSEVDLVRSLTGMAVKAGSPVPDIGSLEAFTRTVLAARSIGHGPSASGLYLTRELFPSLGIADRVLPKARRIDDEPVGAAVARGDVEIGFQQISELLPVPGITIVGPLPPGAQRPTLFSAGVGARATNPDAARALVRYLVSPAVADRIRQTGLEPLSVP